MSKKTLLSSLEVCINEALNRILALEGLDKKALQSEFREWITAIESDYKNYEILYINKINL